MSQEQVLMMVLSVSCAIEESMVVFSFSITPDDDIGEAFRCLVYWWL